MEDAVPDPPTSLTVPRSVLAELRVVKAEMSRDDGRTVRLPEVVSRLIGYYRRGLAADEAKNGSGGDWLDDLARASREAAIAKFGPMENGSEEERDG